ncbi:MAG: restriction endonuclease subunit S, partial [Betaproteobacteria bacterium]
MSDKLPFLAITNNSLAEHIDTSDACISQQIQCDWKGKELGSLIEYKKGFAFKSNSYSDVGEVLIVRVSDTTDSSINIVSCMKIGLEDAILLNEYKLQTDDLIIATVGSWADNPKSIVGKVIRVPLNANGALLNQNAVRLRANEITTQKFLYYKLKDIDFSNYLLNNAQGSANQASITLKDIFSYDIKLPSLPEQKAIAAVLSSLDDKIDLLHRQNKTLEAMAETLFRQWFIVEAKEDWEEGVISDLIEFNPSRKLTKGSIAPYLDMASLSTTSFNPAGWYDREFS